MKIINPCIKPDEVTYADLIKATDKLGYRLASLLMQDYKSHALTQNIAAHFTAKDNLHYRTAQPSTIEINGESLKNNGHYSPTLEMLDRGCLVQRHIGAYTEKSKCQLALKFSKKIGFNISLLRQGTNLDPYQFTIDRIFKNEDIVIVNEDSVSGQKKVSYLCSSYDQNKALKAMEAIVSSIPGAKLEDLTAWTALQNLSTFVNDVIDEPGITRFEREMRFPRQAADALMIKLACMNIQA